MKGENDMPMLRLVPVDETPTDEPLRFPTDAVRTINDARTASMRVSSAPSPASGRGSTRDVMNALCDVTRRANDLSRDLDVLGHLGGDDDSDDDRPCAA